MLCYVMLRKINVFDKISIENNKREYIEIKENFT